MDALAPAVFLLARLLVFGPDGTQALSEHRARVPVGASGLIQERIDVPGLPGAVHLYLTPLRRAAPPRGTEAAGSAAPAPVVRVRAQLWRDPARLAAGAPPDEVNQEEVALSTAGAVLVQVAEEASGERRLMLSIAALEADEIPRTPPSIPNPAAPSPREVSFRVEAYRDRGGARELIQRHVLSTVVGGPVSWESAWKRPIATAGTGGTVLRDEGIRLTLTPQSIDGGWVGVEARLEATLLPAEGTQEPRRTASTASRLTPLGIPFEIALEAPPEEDDGVGGPSSLVVEVTPFVPAGR